MAENAPTARKQRNIRPCTKCNLSHYGPKDDQCPRISVIPPNGEAAHWILPEGGRRRAPRAATAPAAQNDQVPAAPEAPRQQRRREDGQDEDSQDEDSLDDSEIESEDDVPPPVRRRTAGWLSDEGWAKRHDSRGHHLRKIVSQIRGIDTRGRCIVCGSHASFKCLKCDIWLCCN